MANAIVLFPGTAAVAVSTGDAGAVFTNSGPSTVYYGSQPTTSSSVNNGSIAPSASATLYGQQFFAVDRTAQRTDLQVAQNPPVSTSLPSPSRTRKVLGAVDGQLSPNASTYTEQHAALWLPRGREQMPRAKATNVTRCDTLTGVTGNTGSQSIDATRPGLGAIGSIKLLGPASQGNVNAVIPLTGAPWTFGDGATPTGYLRVWLIIDDSRDVADSCITNVNVELATAAGFTNSIRHDMGSVVTGDGVPTRVKSRNTLTCVEMSMIDKDDADMPVAGGSQQGIWAENGTGFATGDWAAITQCRVTLTTKNPANGGAYVQPTVWIAGIERVALPPYALLTFQNDWPMPDHDGIWGEVHAEFGVVPMCLCYPSLFRNTQGSTEMTLTQYLNMIERRGFDAGIYAVQNTNLPRNNGITPETGLPASSQVNGASSSVADGTNNFGGGNATTPGVPWQNYSMAAVEQDIAETQAYFAEYNLPGWDQLVGQERKMRNDNLAQGMALLRKYGSFSHTPQTVDYPMHWPPNDPMRASTYMLDATRDFVDDNNLTANAQNRIRRAIKNKEWLRILCHEMHPGSGTAGLPLPRLRTFLTYATAAGRFDGTAGKIVSQSEAQRIFHRYST